MSSKTKRVFELLLLLLLLAFAVNPSAALENTSHETIKTQYKSTDNYSDNSTNLKGTNDIETEILLQSYRNFDQTLSMLNVVVAGMGVLVALITLIFAIVAFLGFSGYKTVREFRLSTKNITSVLLSDNYNKNHHF